MSFDYTTCKRSQSVRCSRQNKILAQVCIARAQVHPSGEENERQNHLRRLVFNLYGATVKFRKCIRSAMDVDTYFMTFIYSHGGSGSLLVKVTDSWLARHEFESSSTEDSQCTGD
ncbi:hypothetical protein TNCV_4315451 [Trichonephila clavipes]|nr:hypothetical protein TNCV_4315451 [Trichonephila clavipes]